MERKWWTLIVVCLGTFMLLLDITIVNVALPKIATDLKASFSDIQWVIDAYALTLASLLLTAGTLADLLGRRLMFSIGFGLFAFTSLLCALSPSALFLIFARAGQGVGGAIMFSTALALLAQEFHGRERGTAFGVWGATIAASAAVGPLLGGALTEGLGWSSIFYINVPVGIVGVILALSRVAESRDPEDRRIDWVGTVTFTSGLFLLVLAIIRGNASGWGSPLIVSLFVAAVVLLAAFVVSQFKQPQAMFDMSLFRKPTFSGASLVAFTLSSGMFAMFLYLVLYLQTILGFSPLQTGLRFLPFTVISFFVAAASGNLSTRVPVRLLLGGGLLLTGVGLLLMRGLTTSSGWTA
ncbi:MAG: DHA2 family efflux MFS transporter permease subunit, partial [Solirubrobacterales bacterium]|nr:DHA2 family efflux MFS transporter permease subunit [Solirubrobacterales bacterium]